MKKSQTDQEIDFSGAIEALHASQAALGHAVACESHEDFVSNIEQALGNAEVLYSELKGALLSATTEEMTGPERLRLASCLAGNTMGADRWSAEEWLLLHRAYRKSEYDLTPDYWTPLEISEALAGRGSGALSEDCPCSCDDYEPDDTCFHPGRRVARRRSA